MIHTNPEEYTYDRLWDLKMGGHRVDLGRRLSQMLSAAVNILNSDFFVIFCSKFTCSTNVCAQMFACLAESCYGRRS
jgi:hypothetical protein